MNKHLLAAVLSAALVLAGPAFAKGHKNDQNATAAHEKGVTYGTVKSYDQNGKIVIDVPHRMDKSYNLKNPGKSEKINVASDIKVGDPVEVRERTENGMKYVDIARRTEPMTDNANAKYDRNTAEKGVWHGTVKSVDENGNVVINVPNGKDKTYNYRNPGKSEKVNWASDLKVGDPVDVRERKENGITYVDITGRREPMTDNTGTAATKGKKHSGRHTKTQPESSQSSSTTTPNK